MKAIRHFFTVWQHRRLVRKGCFKLGLYWQGLTHDLSKYSPTEFLVGARYFQGTRSPNNAEREDKGYSEAWLHHKGRNKHHYEYWIDYSSKEIPGGMCPVPMPDRYIAEMFVDRVSACKIYQKRDYRIDSPLKYFQSGKYPPPMHPYTYETLERLLVMLAQKGEDETYCYIRKTLLQNKK